MVLREKKGDIVKVVKSNNESFFLTGKSYKVIAGDGDADEVCGGVVEDDGMVIMSELGSLAFCVFPECLFGEWELIK